MKKALVSTFKIGLASMTMTVAFSASAIIGGRSADPRIGRSSIYIFDERAENACTGVVVHPRLILTAAHCVVNSKKESLTFSNESSPQEGRRFHLPIAELVTNEAYAGARNGIQTVTQSAGDLAIILMSEPVLSKLGLEQKDLPPIVRSVDQVTPPLRVIGYGFSSRNSRFSSTSRRELLVSTRATANARTLTLESMEGSRTPCFGDSGSGVFADDGSIARLVGIVSSIRAGGKLAETFAAETAKLRAKKEEKRQSQIAKLRQKKARDGLSTEAIEALVAEVKLEPIRLSESLMIRVCGDVDTVTQAVPVARHLCWIREATSISLVPELDCPRPGVNR
ncbi:MAG: S1 family peptidase [Bdellovibrionota bacterium]